MYRYVSNFLDFPKNDNAFFGKKTPVEFCTLLPWNFVPTPVEFCTHTRGILYRPDRQPYSPKGWRSLILIFNTHINTQYGFLLSKKTRIKIKIKKFANAVLFFGRKRPQKRTVQGYYVCDLSDRCTWLRQITLYRAVDFFTLFFEINDYLTNNF